MVAARCTAERRMRGVDPREGGREALGDRHARPLGAHAGVRIAVGATRRRRPGRAGAVTLLAAFDVHTGQVLGLCRRRKRQVEVIELLEAIDRETPAAITTIHILCDNVSTQHGKLVRQWLAQHPGFQFHFTPVHCSWMNQVEQWFSILQRQRLAAPRFADLAELETKIVAFIAAWNERAHPFHWTRESFRKVLARIDAEIAKAA